MFTRMILIALLMGPNFVTGSYAFGSFSIEKKDANDK